MSHRWRRHCKRIIALVLLASMITCQSFAVSTSATSAVLMDVESGRVLYAQNADARMLIASTTKVMTALVAIEHGDLSRTVTIKKSQTLVEGTSMYLKEGEQLTLETLLYGLLLCSGNDAALAIADAVGGSREKFVSMMNAKAKELGMTNTSFANPNGLDDEKHYSTAMDMARLARAAAQNETLMRIASTRRVTIGGRTMVNHNKLLTYFDGCIGLKTGYTKAAGRTLLSCAVRNGQRLVAVTLQDGNDWADHEALYEFGFAAYSLKCAQTAGDTLARIRVEGGTQTSVCLLAADSFTWPMGAEETFSVTAEELPDSLQAPVSAGTAAGYAVVRFNGKEIGRVRLVCGETVPLSLPKPMSLFHRLQGILTG